MLGDLLMLGVAVLVLLAIARYLLPGVGDLTAVAILVALVAAVRWLLVPSAQFWAYAELMYRAHRHREFADECRAEIKDRGLPLPTDPDDVVEVRGMAGGLDYPDRNVVTNYATALREAQEATRRARAVAEANGWRDDENGRRAELRQLARLRRRLQIRRVVSAASAAEATEQLDWLEGRAGSLGVAIEYDRRDRDRGGI